MAATMTEVSLVDRGRVVKSGGGTGGHVIQNGAGTDMTARSKLQFKGADVSDDSTNNRTVVNMSYTEINYEDWLELTEQEKETGRWDVVGVPGADGTVSFDLMTKLWENSSPTSAMANNTEINLSSDNYDLLLVICKATDSSTTNTVTTIAKKGADIQLSYPASTSSISQRFLRYQTDIKYKTSDATDTTKTIPLIIYGIKTKQTVEIKAIAPEVSTSASKCMMSNGETSVEDALNYSTDEHIVGTWIDGSDLYEKTFSITNPSSGTVDIATLVGEVVDIQGIFRRTDGAVIPSPYYDGGTYRLFYTISTNSVLSMYTAGYTISEAIVTVLYIKN